MAPQVDFLTAAPAEVPGYFSSGGSFRPERAGSAVAISDTDFLVYAPVLAPDQLGIARFSINSSGALTNTWYTMHAQAWSTSSLLVLAREVVGDKFVVLLNGSGVFKIKVYSLTDGSEVDSLDVDLSDWEGGGISLYAYSSSAAWLFWANDLQVFGQTLTLAGPSLGDPVELATLTHLPNPMYPVTLGPGVCGLYAWAISGGAGKFLEIRDSSGSPSVSHSFTTPDAGNGTNTNFVAVTGGVGFTWFNDDGSYVFGRANWNSGSGFTGYTVQHTDAYSLNHEPNEESLNGLETMAALSNAYLADAYTVIGGGDPTLTLDLYDFTTAPTSLQHASAAVTASRTVPSDIQPIDRHGSPDGAEVRATPIGTGWFAIVWGGETGPYVLIAQVSQPKGPVPPFAPNQDMTANQRDNGVRFR